MMIILLLSVDSGRAANIIRPQHTTAQAMVWCSTYPGKHGA